MEKSYLLIIASMHHKHFNDSEYYYFNFLNLPVSNIDSVQNLTNILFYL